MGTGSPRRAAQLRAARPDLDILDIRGNVDTRLGRVPGLPGNATDAVVAGKSCDLDAVVLAAAGLERISRLDAVSEYLETDVMLPAAGQGSLAIECRTADAPRKPGSTEGSQGPLAQALAALDDHGHPAGGNSRARAAGPARGRLRRPGGSLRLPQGKHALPGGRGLRR